MVKNKCLDEIKIKNNRRRLDDDIGNLNSGSVNNLGPQIITLHNFKALSDTLPAKEVEILSMHLEGYTAQEIACNYKLSEKTVRNKIAIAKAKIRTIWHKFMEQ
jgi:DNA-binding CsgD family transcriptional regulator